LKLIAPTDPLSHSADLTAENIDRLREIFPQAVTEDGGGKRIDFDVLRELLGGELATGEEKYGLNWHGKRAARRLALTPSTGTLRPAPEDSVDWDTTQNLMIEGDNLEVLKLLQKSYASKIKMIYIDPPYNTGKDFVYKDDFRDSIGNYQRITGQRDAEGAKLTTNAESSGRFHTDWLNMMYPRLILARNLLKDDGIIFVSLDETEIQALRALGGMVFGDECFVACLTVLCNPKGRSQDKYFATTHEYVMVFSRSVLPKGSLSIEKATEQIEAEYTLEDELGKYRLLELRNTHREFGKHNRPNLHYPLFLSEIGELLLDREVGAVEIKPDWDDGFQGCWTWGPEKAEADLELLVAKEVSGKWKIYRKSYAHGSDRMLKTILSNKSYYTERGQRELNGLFNTRERVFQSPKSPFLLSELLATSTSDSDIVLDFFAGSGTLGDAVQRRNAIDGSTRRYILSQLPTSLSENNPEQKLAAEFCTTIGKPLRLTEITKERLRRSALQIKAANPLFHGDLGFRVLKLDTTSIRPWDPTLPVTGQRLLGEVDNILPGRTEQDLLYELLLKRGLELTVPIVERTLAGKQVFAVSTGDLIACLAPHIESADVEALAEGIVTWHKELAPPPVVDPNAPLEKPAKFDPPLVVFRDTAFADDVAKSNLTEILKQHSLTDVRSL
jgi:adenine-specific DNA-methyltransferase